MSALDRAEEIAGILTAAGGRVSLDPRVAAANLPGFLLTPPGRTWDLSCGYTARWEIAALVPAATGADVTSWRTLDGLADMAADVLPVETAQLVTYNLAGVDYPAYLLSWSEALT